MTSFREMVDTGFFMYMAEAEGLDSLVDTRTSRINAIIKDFKYIKNCGKDPNCYITEILNKHGFSSTALLTEAECQEIMRAVDGY